MINDKITIGGKMENKIIKYVISFILCVALFAIEIILLIQFNLSKGIRKQDIIKIIDNINIEEEIKEMDNYYKLEKTLKPEIIREIVNSEELGAYVKENAKNMILSLRYGENINYASDQELKAYINNKVGQLEELNEITPDDKQEILNVFDEMAKEIGNKIEEVDKIDSTIVSKLLSNKTTTYLLLATILLSFIILAVNQNKTGFIFTGLPTIIAGVIFLMIELSITKTINSTGIDENIIHTINVYLPNLLKTLKKSSIIMTIIGFMECALYTVLNYQEMSSENGKI